MFDKIFVRRNAVKRDAGDVFGIQPTDAQFDFAERKLTPTVAIEPYINFLKAATSSTTMFTTPTNKDFFLTNLVITNADISNAQITITPFGMPAAAIAAAGNSGTAEKNGSVVNIVFPMRGLLLARGSTIVSVSPGAATFMVAGYIASP